ncbi:transcription/translation regulatory transformer protein RfaH [Ferrimonas balearica]|uniref:transcription/translation regulatory transformer protein RfaH n=1 Tax=Ferrimonas balearica TaxID=44012 RepID=UPI001C999D94|nr:transcription/translation regulatory transformer protein RfaH [Ferrimonas balearica]MBY5921270.1 transcription/translation regulatory transformer protein RfaH [Ferrimonas balearica]MBY5996045.1 transcription/translation regulatory transformer protein RfaH [Ferrimonas balearica]
MLGWYLLYCKGKKEATARAHLEQRNLGCFLPEAEVECIKRGKRTKEMVPLFPNYLFVRFDPFQTPIRTVLSVPGVSSVVRTDGQMVPVDTSLVVGLRQRLSQSPCTISELPQAGDKVEILDGPFASLNAVFCEPDGATRSRLLLNILGNQQHIALGNLSIRRL